ncbi:hypothetical protein AMTRI_Chr10g4980 [Amborella trichopoda]
MAREEMTWADQWDYSNPDPTQEKKDEKKKGGSWFSSTDAKKKVGDGFEKSKAVASAGAKKAKEGTVSGIQWIKDRCSKTNNPNK